MIKLSNINITRGQHHISPVVRAFLEKQKKTHHNQFVVLRLENWISSTMNEFILYVAILSVYLVVIPV